MPSSLREKLGLDREIVEHRLDDEIDVGEICRRRRHGQPRQPFSRPSASSRPDATLRSSSAAMRSRPLAAASPSVRRRSRDSRHRAPRPRCPTPSGRFRRRRSCAPAAARRLPARRPWPLRARRRRHGAAPWLFGIAQLQEGRALVGQSLGQRAFAPPAHQPQRLGWRLLSARPRQYLRGHLFERFGVGGRHRQFAGAARRLAGQFARGRDGLRDEIAGRRRSSTMPSDSASAADTTRPVALSSTAATMPASRGSRCVPPAPGTMPSLTSGRPSFAAARRCGDGSRARSPARRPAPRR